MLRKGAAEVTVQAASRDVECLTVETVQSIGITAFCPLQGGQPPIFLYFPEFGPNSYSKHNTQ